MTMKKEDVTAEMASTGFKSNGSFLPPIPKRGGKDSANRVEPISDELNSSAKSTGDQRRIEEQTALLSPRSDGNLQKRIDARNKYAIKNFEMDNSKEYFESLSFHVSLNDLYVLEDAINNNQNNLFSPVILRIVDPTILKANETDEAGTPYAYLMQVWNHVGVLIYERKLTQKPALWNMSGKALLFKETVNSCNLYMIKLRNNKHPSLYRLDLPQKIAQNVTQLGFVDSHILMAVGQSIFYFDSNALLQGQTEEAQKYQKRASLDMNADVVGKQFMFQFSLQSSDLKEIAVDDGYTIKAFVEYSGEKITKKALSQMMAVFERNVDHVLVFMKVNFERKEDKDTLMLEVLGDTVKKPFIVPSTIPIKKWLLQVSNDADGNPFSTAVALREDGSTDFYYNFRRVESNNETLISDIDFDFTYIYLRELNDSEEGETLHRIMHSWKGRIGMSVVESKLLEQAKLNRTWSRITSKRVSTYMKLYASLCTYEAYVLVAHRNFVSVFDISHETWQHNEYNDLVRYMGQTVRTNTKNADSKDAFRYTDKYKVAIVVGSNEVHFIVINELGQLPQKQERHTIKIDGMIRRCFKDELKYHGIYLLLTSEPAQPIMFEEGANSFNRFELISENDEKFKLVFLTENKLWTLLDQNNPKDLEAHELLCDKTSFVNYFDMWPQTEHVHVYHKHRQHPTTFRKMLMIFNPRTCKMKAFQINSARALSKPGNEQFFSKPFQGVSREPQHALEFDVSNYCTSRSKLLGVKTWLDPTTPQANSMILITQDKYLVYDGARQLKYVFDGFRNGSVSQASELYTYTIQDSMTVMRVSDSNDELQTEDKRFKSAGCYLFDFSSMFEGKLEQFKLDSAAIGNNIDLVLSNFSKQIVFMKDNSEILICPFAHRNLINLIGISHKSEYLIWRESQGFFSAMNRNGQIQTWSLATGNKLYNMNTYIGKTLHNYDVYCADEDDDSYHLNRHNYGHMSKSLIVSREPLLKLKKHELSQFYQAQSKFKFNMQTELSHQTKVLAETSDTLQIERDEKPRGLYNFYLLEMYGHMDIAGKFGSEEFEDQRKEIESLRKDEEVRIAMEFKFELAENIKMSKIEAAKCWDSAATPTSHIYISANQKRLLEVVNRQAAIIYEIASSEDVHDHEGKFSHIRVSWKKQIYIDRFPQLLQGNASVNFLFSSNFNYYLDFDYANNELLIRKTSDQSRYWTIPSDMLNFDNKNGAQMPSEVAQIGKNICFHTLTKGGALEERMLRIVNKDDVECIFRFDTTDLHMLSYAKVDNNTVLRQSMNKRTSLWDQSRNKYENKHNILEQRSIPNEETLPRLIRLMQQYKTKITHDATLKNKSVSSQLNQLYCIDYGHDWQGSKAVFVSELSFTILAWKIAEKLINENDFEFKSLDSPTKLMLLFCVFPKSQTIMHKLANCEKGADEAIQHLYDTAKEGLQTNFSIFKAGTSFEVPFLLDGQGCTPIDLALGVGSRTSRQQSYEENLIDLQLAGVFLKNLKDAPFLNQGQMMVRSVIDCIKHKVPGVGTYLDNRFKAIECMPGEIQEQMRSSIQKQVGDIDYGTIHSTPWMPESRLISQMYEKNGWNCRYSNSFFDLPWIHDFTVEGRDFLEACKQNDDIKFFSSKSIQMIVNEHWERWRPAIYGLKLIPFTLLLLTFMFWSNLILTHSHSEPVLNLLASAATSVIITNSTESNFTALPDANSTLSDVNSTLSDVNSTLGTSALRLDEAGYNIDAFRKADIGCCWFLIIVSTFFMLTEIQAFVYNPKIYILGFSENFTDLTPLVLIYVNTIRSLSQSDTLPLSFWVIQSLAGILIWVKFIWFLRTVSYFSYLIQSLTQAFRDINAFFIILLLACIGYGDAFHSLSRSMGDNSFVEGYYDSFKFSWLFVIGQGGLPDNTNAYGDIIYFTASVIMIIVMLNVLIAIAGEALGNAQENKIEFAYKAKTELLVELMDHPFARLLRFAKQGQAVAQNNLLFVSEVCNEQQNQNEEQQQQQ